MRNDKSPYEVPIDRHHNIFSYLDNETTEDVIFIYLQVQGWIVVPNSRKADTMAYEFVAIHHDPHERALVQVKSGNTALDRGGWGRFQEKIFLFQANGAYYGDPAPNVVALSPKIIEDFMRGNMQIMPRSVQRWIEYCAPR